MLSRPLTSRSLSGILSACGLLVCSSLVGCGAGTIGVLIAPGPPAAGTVGSAILSPAAIVFPQTFAGSTSQPQTVTLSNHGAGPLDISAYALGDSVDFAVTTSCGNALAAGASCTWTVTFQPKAAANFTSNLALTDTSGGNSASHQIVTLSGAGEAPPKAQAVISASSLFFAGQAPVSKTVSVTNTGNGPLTFSSISLSDQKNFQLASTCPTSLPPNQSCSLSITYNPATPDTPIATLTLVDNSGGSLNATQTLNLTGLIAASVTHFGDSITCGLYAFPHDGSGYIWSNEGYAGDMDAAIGLPAQNFCHSGDQVADMTFAWVYPKAQPALGLDQLYTVLIGTNDANACGASSGCESNYTSALNASLAWLALPLSDKVIANTIGSRTGYWYGDSAFPYCLKAVGPGATLSFPVSQVVANRPLYLVNRVGDGSYFVGGAADVSVDGVYATTLHSDPQSGRPIYTENTDPDSLFLQKVPLGAIGTHTVTLTTTSQAGATFDFVWAGASSANYATIPGAPRVLAGGVITSPSASLVPILAQYNSIIAAAVSSLAADGLNIQLVPSATALNPATDFYDSLHPNTTGHAKLASVFLNLP